MRRLGVVALVWLVGAAATLGGGGLGGGLGGTLGRELASGLTIGDLEVVGLVASRGDMHMRTGQVEPLAPAQVSSA